MKCSQRLLIVTLLALTVNGTFFGHSLAQNDEAAALHAKIVELHRAGKYSEALPFAQRELAIREKTLGPNHLKVAASVINLADLYGLQSRYADAEPLYTRSLTIREKALGPDHRDVARSLNDLAIFYQNQTRYTDAEPLFKRSLAITEKAFGPDHRNVAASLNNLALLYRNQGRYADAEPLFKRSLAINEKVLGPDHPNVAAGPLTTWPISTGWRTATLTPSHSSSDRWRLRREFSAPITRMLPYPSLHWPISIWTSIAMSTHYP